MDRAFVPLGLTLRELSGYSCNMRASPTVEDHAVKIWGRTSSANVQKVLWCCAELALDYERVDWGGKFGGNDDTAYRDCCEYDCVTWTNASVRCGAA